MSKRERKQLLEAHVISWIFHPDQKLRFFVATCMLDSVKGPFFMGVPALRTLSGCDWSTAEVRGCLDKLTKRGWLYRVRSGLGVSHYVIATDKEAIDLDEEELRKPPSKRHRLWNPLEKK